MCGFQNAFVGAGPFTPSFGYLQTGNGGFGRMYKNISCAVTRGGGFPTSLFHPSPSHFCIFFKPFSPLSGGRSCGERSGGGTSSSGADSRHSETSRASHLPTGPAAEVGFLGWRTIFVTGRHTVLLYFILFLHCIFWVQFAPPPNGAVFFCEVTLGLRRTMPHPLMCVTGKMAADIWFESLWSLDPNRESGIFPEIRMV